MKISFIPISEIRRIRESVKNPIDLCQLLSNIFRINALSMIMEAGSGHLGTSFSSIDIVTWLWTQVMRSPNQKDVDNHDIYFSSKGHDAPALYSLLIGLEKLDYGLIHKLRRLNGLPGHPDVATPFIMANTGSLGMGISKARGMAIANRLNGRQSHIFVLSGDGELQEGQIWESLQPTANGNFSEITLIVDHNKMQSDTWVEKVSALGQLEKKFLAFGWEVKRTDGHNFSELKKTFEQFATVTDRPQVLIAETVKGKGVSFTESGSTKPGELYQFHSGAPAMELYQKALAELLEKVNQRLNSCDQKELILESSEFIPKPVLLQPENLISAYGDELAKIGRQQPELVVLDGDLMKDCGLIPFKEEFPERFIECGIAEQDMVSAAGGLALQGKIPVVHSFACFLSTRPNEQIYNNATEKTKIIYTGSLAGLVPAMPGHSHQSVRDISILGAIPGLKMIEPCCEQETRLALRWAVMENKKSSYIRLVSVPYQLPYQLPEDYRLIEGQGINLIAGQSAAIFAYGPVMLTEAVLAAQILRKKKFNLAVFNLPWLNTIDADWLLDATEPFKTIFTLDDHYKKFSQGSLIAGMFSQSGQSKRVVALGLEDVPQCGQNKEVLNYHGLDSESIAQAVATALKLSPSAL